MSTMMSTEEGPRTSIVMAPPVPSGETPAFPSARMPASQFRFEVMGTAPPAGNAKRLPLDAGAQTEKLNETAVVPVGIPHCPVIVKFRCAPPPSIDGDP